VKNGDKSIEFAKNFHLPLVIGIEKYIPGNFDHFMASLGHVGFTVEAGQHASEDAIRYHEAVIWQALIQTGILQQNMPPSIKNQIEVLINSKSTVPNYEVVFKYELQSGEKFKMEPGFTNFQPIKKGEILAYDDGKPVVSKWDGNIFMPLYQSQGKDGFFVVISK
jgi:succinylglutamate desuccinylase